MGVQSRDTNNFVEVFPNRFIRRDIIVGVGINSKVDETPNGEVVSQHQVAVIYNPGPNIEPLLVSPAFPTLAEAEAELERVLQAVD